MKKYILPFVAFLSIFLYLISFFTGKNKKNENDFMFLTKNEEALLNEISISKNGNTIIFEKTDGFWKGVFVPAEISASLTTENTDEKQTRNYFPVDETVFNNSLKKLQARYRVTKITSDSRSLEDYGLEPENALNISCFLENGKVYTIVLGKNDFTNTKRYILLPEKNAVYKINSDFYDFNHAEIRYWYDPYILPKTVFAKNDEIQLVKISNGVTTINLISDNSETFMKLSELRHGAVVFDKDFSTSEPVLKMNVEYGKNNYISMDFYKKEDENYLIHYYGSSWNYSSYVSEWTFNSILELSGIN